MGEAASADKAQPPYSSSPVALTKPESDYYDQFVPKDGRTTYDAIRESIESGKSQVTDAVLFCGRFDASGRMVRECAKGAKPYKLLRCKSDAEFREAVAQERRVREFFTSSSDAGSTFAPDPNQYTEFTPYFSGPFNKQQYYDYFIAHSRAFEQSTHGIGKRIVDIMRQYAIGRGVSVRCSDDEKDEAWNEYAESCDLMHKLRSYWTREYLVYGENFIDLKRMVSVDPSTILDIVCDGYGEYIDDVLYYQQMFQCLHGDTRIALLDGTNPTIKELAERQEEYWVYSYDHSTGRIVPGKAIKTWKQPGQKRCVRVTLDSGESVIASFDHPFMMRDGSYVWAENLKAGDSLMPLYRKRGYEKVWQPKTGWEFTHHSIAGKPVKGECVHHKNHNHSDNRPDNLETLTTEAHREIHRRSKRIAIAESSASFYMRNPEWRKKLSEARKASYARNPKLREEQSKRTRKQWEDASIRAKMSKGISAAWDRKQTEALAKQSAIVNHKVVSVEEVGMCDVFDLTVDKYHNFALSIGVFTHNTATQMWSGIKVPGVAGSADTKVGQYIIRQIPYDQIVHVKANVVSVEKRGRSFLFPVLGWIKRLTDTLNAKVLSEQLKNSLVYDDTVDGSPAQVDAHAARFNYIPVAPTLFAHNKTVTRQLLAPHQGASASSDIIQELLSFIAAIVGLPRDHLNTIVSGAGSRATAIVASEPFSKVIEDGQEDIDFLLRRLIEEFCKSKGIDYVRDEWSIIFPSVTKDSTKDTLGNIALAESQDWFSKERAATMAAAEMDQDDYDFDSEQQDIKTEKAEGLAEPVAPPPPAGRFGSDGGSPADDKQDIIDQHSSL